MAPRPTRSDLAQALERPLWTASSRTSLVAGRRRLRIRFARVALTREVPVLEKVYAKNAERIFAQFKGAAAR